MRPSRRRVTTRVGRCVLALVAAAAACGKADAPASDSARLVATPAPVAGNASGNADPRKPACPKTGHWVDCQVRERLIRSGRAPRATTRAGLRTPSPRPASYRIGSGGLAPYLFDATTAPTRAPTTLDTVKYVRAPNPPTILSEATLIENDNLLALLFSKNEQQIERVSDALMAGPPQP